jgi:hypothetical protein
MQSELWSKFEHVTNFSVSTICRALRFDLSLTRKVLTKRARESAPRERREYAARLLPFYGGPDQLVFVDETSKDGRFVVCQTIAEYSLTAVNIVEVYCASTLGQSEASLQS